MMMMAFGWVGTRASVPMVISFFVSLYGNIAVKIFWTGRWISAIAIGMASCDWGEIPVTSPSVAPTSSFTCAQVSVCLISKLSHHVLSSRRKERCIEFRVDAVRTTRRPRYEFARQSLCWSGDWWQSGDICLNEDNVKHNNYMNFLCEPRLRWWIIGIGLVPSPKRRAKLRVRFQWSITYDRDLTCITVCRKAATGPWIKINELIQVIIVIKPSIGRKTLTSMFIYVDVRRMLSILILIHRSNDSPPPIHRPRSSAHVVVQPRVLEIRHHPEVQQIRPCRNK